MDFAILFQTTRIQIKYFSIINTVIVYLSFLTEMEDTTQQSSGHSEDLNEIEY